MILHGPRVDEYFLHFSVVLSTNFVVLLLIIYYSTIDLPKIQRIHMSL